MDILREISRSSLTRNVASISSDICVLQARLSSRREPNSDLELSQLEKIDKTILFEKIRNNQLFPQSSPLRPNRPDPRLSIVFFPEAEWKAIAQDEIRRIEVFDYLRLDSALLAYLVSSRSGWYHVTSDGRYNFMIKDYLYMLAWTFDPSTLETRAMLAARSEYRHRSSLKNGSGDFHLPGLRTAHLYHPLSLACLCLTDFVFYFDRIIIDEGYTIGHIEKDTGHGLWVKDETQTHNFTLETLMVASRNIAKIIGIFANLFKSVEVTHTLVESLQDGRTWRDFYGRHDSESLMNFDYCTESFGSAIGLLKLRMKTIKQSGRVFDERAKAQSNVIATLIRRQDAVTGHRLAKASKKLAEATKKDSSDMKVIAIMTMAFLPATFFAALFDLPTLAWDQPQVITNNFWVYWAFTLPTTLVVFALWYVLNERKLNREANGADKERDMERCNNISDDFFGNPSPAQFNGQSKSNTRYTLTGIL